MERENYIVRIYERSVILQEGKEDIKLSGIIEDVESDIKKTFHSVDDLWEFISRSTEDSNN